MEQAFNEALARAGVPAVAAEEVRKAARDWAEESQGETEGDNDPDDDPSAMAASPPGTGGFAHAGGLTPSTAVDPPHFMEVTNAEGVPLFKRTEDGYGGYTYVSVDRGYTYVPGDRPPPDASTEGS